MSLPPLRPTMIQFLRETLQLVYWVFFMPSRLQARLNEISPQTRRTEKGQREPRPTDFRDILRNWRTNPQAGRLLAQFATCWGLVIFPFWLLVPWGQIGSGYLAFWLILALPLLGLGFASLDVYPLALTAPLLLGLLLLVPPPTLMALATDEALLSIFYRLPIAILLATLTGGGGGYVVVLAGQRWGKRVRQVVVFVAVVVAFVVAFAVAGVVADDMAGTLAIVVAIVVATVAVGVAVGMANNVTDTLAGTLAILVAFCVAGVVAFFVAGVVAFFVAGVVAVVVAFVVAVAVTAFVAFLVAGTLAGSVVIFVAGVVAGVVAVAVAVAVAGLGYLLLPLLLLMALWLGLAFSRRQLALGGELWIHGAGTALIFIQGRWLEAALFLVVALTSHYRLPIYLWEQLRQGWLTWQAHRQPARALYLLTQTPALFDEYIYFSLRGLDTLLILAAEEDPQATEPYLVQIATLPYQQGAVREARLELAARQLRRTQTLYDLAASENAFNWLGQTSQFRRAAAIHEVRRHLLEASRAVARAEDDPREPHYSRNLHAAQQAVQDLTMSLATLDRRTVQQFAPVAQQWRKLLQEATAERLENPYVTGNPLHHDETDLFVGRTDIYRAIRAALETVHGKPTLVIYGARRMGKTTVLLHLPRLLPLDIVPVYVDLQGVQAQSEAGFYYALAQAICQESQTNRQLTLPPPDLSRFLQEPTLLFRHWLDEALVALENRPLLLAIDEFELLGEQIRAGQLPERILATLRHLIQHVPRLYLLLAGVSTLEALGPNWHSYFISVQPLKVSYLDEESAKRLITRPIPNWPLDVRPEAVAHILHLTRAQPYLVQLLCAQLVAWFNTPQRREQPEPRTANLADVEAAAQRALTVGEPYFTNLWEDAKPAGQGILAQLAQEPTGFARPVDEEGRAALRYLERLELVEEVAGEWRIQVELTRRWLARHSLR